MAAISLTLNLGGIFAFGDLRFSSRLGRYRFAAHAVGMRRSVNRGGCVPHEWLTCMATLRVYRLVNTCQPCDAHRIPDKDRRSGCCRAGSVASCVGRKECGSPRPVGDTRGGLGFNGAWRVVAGRAAFRVAAYPHSEAARLTALLERFSPFHF